MPETPQVPISGVWLLREGDFALVLVQIGGRWYEAIRELADNNYSHNITGFGLIDLDEPVPWLNQSTD